MKITIHRGINQIGGCITKIATAHNRILVDLEQNLPDNKGIVHDDLANSEAIAKLTVDIDAIFYTHYHGDHDAQIRYGL
jgi:ribonuclease J